MQYGFWDWAEAVMACVFLNWMARPIYIILGSYRPFKPSWRRLLVAGLFPVMGFGLLVELWYLSTH